MTPLTAGVLTPFLPAGAEVLGKLELFQQAGSFKARGALLNLLDFSEDERAHGHDADQLNAEVGSSGDRGGQRAPDSGEQVGGDRADHVVDPALLQ